MTDDLVIEYDYIEVNTVRKLFADDIIINHEILGDIRISSYADSFRPATKGLYVSCKPSKESDFFIVTFSEFDSKDKERFIDVAINHFLKMLNEDL